MEIGVLSGELGRPVVVRVFTSDGFAQGNNLL